MKSLSYQRRALVVRDKPGHDHETRQRVLQTAARLFSESGFKRVTVREICREAEANVASVNYHFRDKLGLYGEVVQLAIEVMRSASAASVEAGKGGSAEAKLRAHVRVYLHHIVDDGRISWIHKLMSREMTDPTPALDLVIDQGIRPRLEYLSGVVAELLGCAVTDTRVLRCIASIQGQCLLYLTTPVRDRLMPGWNSTPAEVDKVADHIAEFSLAGIRAIRRGPRKS